MRADRWVQAALHVRSVRGPLRARAVGALPQGLLQAYAVGALLRGPLQAREVAP